ncbi:EH domain-binding protein 1-like protein 1 [Palaemon carinicauda]|uniref:EH domain-binding protein 1-like protein 1 n=1 Tax=Palaemon carinicauda TaxID=392227 RepID=UPI0035B67BE6
MKQYAGFSTQHDVKIKLRPLSKKVVSASLDFTLSCLFLREGKATDEDMQSMASLMSMNAPNDIAPLEDFDDDDEAEGDAMVRSAEFSQLAAQISSLTHSFHQDDPLGFSLSDSQSPMNAFDETEEDAATLEGGEEQAQAISTEGTSGAPGDTSAQPPPAEGSVAGASSDIGAGSSSASVSSPPQQPSQASSAQATPKPEISSVQEGLSSSSIKLQTTNKRRNGRDKSSNILKTRVRRCLMAVGEAPTMGSEMTSASHDPRGARLSTYR